MSAANTITTADSFLKKKYMPAFTGNTTMLNKNIGEFLVSSKLLIYLLWPDKNNHKGFSIGESVQKEEC